MSCAVLADGFYHLIDTSISSSSGNYLFADTNGNGVTTNIKFNANHQYAGNILWGFELLDDGYYKITSLRVRGSDYTDSMALTYTSSNGSLHLSQYNKNLDSQKWIITKNSNNNTYKLSTKEMPNTFLWGTTFDIGLENQYTEIGLLDKTYSQYTSGSILRVKVVIEEGLIEDCFPSETRATDLFHNAVTAWNALCPNVEIYIADENGNVDSPYEMTCTVTFVGEINNNNDNFGSTKGQPSHSGSVWDSCQIILYTNKIENSTMLARKVITHEMGHALMLGHPENGTVDETNNVLSVMNQSAPSSENALVTVLPTARDIHFLNLKWN